MLLLPGIVAAQTGAIVGVVIDRESGQPLTNSIVEVRQLSRSAFTTDSGAFSFHALSVGDWTLSVRRLGFTPRELPIHVREGATDTLRVLLARVAVRLAGVTVRAWPPCVAPGVPTDSALAVVVQQIRLNAEQYRFLSKQHPFAYTSTASRSGTLRRTGRVVSELPRVEVVRSSGESRYAPGAVIQRRRGLQFFQVPTLIEVADPAFIESHCWHNGGTERIEDLDMIRVDIVAADSLKSPDVNGSFLLHPVTFQIARAVLHLSRKPRELPDLLDMVVTTEFMEVLPSIPVIDRVTSVQTMDPKRRPTYLDTREELRTTNFLWTGAKPGVATPPRDSLNAPKRP